MTVVWGRGADQVAMGMGFSGSKSASRMNFVQEVCEYLAVQRNVETGVQTRKRKSANEEEGESFNNPISPSEIDSGKRKQHRKSLEMKLYSNRKLPEKEFINFKGHRPRFITTSTTNTSQPRCVECEIRGLGMWNVSGGNGFLVEYHLQRVDVGASAALNRP